MFCFPFPEQDDDSNEPTPVRNFALCKVQPGNILFVRGTSVTKTQPACCVAQDPPDVGGMREQRYSCMFGVWFVDKAPVFTFKLSVERHRCVPMESGSCMADSNVAVGFLSNSETNQV